MEPEVKRSQWSQKLSVLFLQSSETVNRREKEEKGSLALYLFSYFSFLLVPTLPSKSPSYFLATFIKRSVLSPSLLRALPSQSGIFSLDLSPLQIPVSGTSPLYLPSGSFLLSALTQQSNHGNKIFCLFICCPSHENANKFKMG